MKLIDNLIFLEFPELIEVGVSEDTLKKASYRKSPSWEFITDPLDKRKVLISYEKLKDNYKKLINERFGNPYDYIAKEPIRKLFESDFKAKQFFKDFRYDDEKRLPFEHITKYTIAASWLNLLIKLNDDKKFIKKQLNLSVEIFFKSVCEIITTNKIDLPTTYQRLRNRMAEYKEKGYECLIDWRFGNKLSAKIGKCDEGFDPELADKQIAFIRKAASLHNNFDAGQITIAVNQIFQSQGWPTVSHGTVYNVIKANGHIVTPGSRGKREYNSNIAMQVKRKAPEYPLQYLTLDGWTVELLYQDKDSYSNRLVAVIVLDAFNKYPIGYAIGERENTELIRQANRNASIHIKELFGAHYQPRQLQSDNYGIKQLTPFYNAMAHLHTPAAVGNAKSKIIEPYFAYLNKKYCQTQPNWSGFNITAKRSNQPNTEFLDKIKHSFPNKDEVIRQIDIIIARERQIKIEQYINQWQAVPDVDKIILNREDFLFVHGKSTGYLNSITGMGLMPTIDGQKLVFDSFNPKFRELRHLKWQVIYDEDYSSVLSISEDGKNRFVLDQKRILPMDVHSMVPDDHSYLSTIKNFNKVQTQKIIDTYAKDSALVQEVMDKTPLNLSDYDEASLKLMFTYNGQQKERIQNAKGLKQIQQKHLKQDQKAQEVETSNWMDLQKNYLQNKTDFNQYLD